MEKLADYLNPIRRLGKKQYSIAFPLFASVSICLFSEILVMYILRNPDAVGIFIIWINIATIMYFSFRDGIRGGVIAALIPVFYYFYIIYTRQQPDQQMRSIETTAVLGILYLVMAWVIGWLKQTVDTLIENEANERRRLQMIVEQLPVGVTITDNKGKVVQTNKKLERILGIRIPKGLVIGKEPLLPTKLKGGGTYTPSQGPLAQVIYSGKTTASKEFIVTRRDGKQLFLQANASAIHNQAGKLIAAAQIVTDITQQRELENRKDDFVNMASHELKTPITSMKLYIDVLMQRIETYKDSRANGTLAKIKTQTERLQELVNDLLDVSRLQTGKLSFTKETFRIDTLVEETVADMQGMAKKQEIIITSNAPVNVHADKFRLYQVLTNLITNAVKYSPNGKQIKVRVKRTNGRVTVSVQDAGIGIAKDQQKKIFDRLYQVIDDKEKTFPGFGMGLYISKEIIKRHKGTIWVESEKDKGSTFFFSLPLKK